MNFSARLLLQKVFNAGTSLYSDVQRQARAPLFGMVVAYFILGCTLVAFHEPWRDEADSWLVARGPAAGTLSDFLSHLSHVGTPGLWYLVLIPFAKVGLPFFTQGLLNVLFCGMAIAIFVFRAPFSSLTKLLFVFSYFPAFEYLAISRSYGLGVLLLFTTAELFSDRDRNPLAFAVSLALLANTNVHSLIVSIVIGTIWLARTPVRHVAAVVAIGGQTLAVLQLWPSPDGLHGGLVAMFRPSSLPEGISQAFFPTIYWSNLWIFGVIVIALTVWLLRHNLSALLTLAGIWGALFYLFVFKYVGGPRHYGLLLMTLLFVLWVGRSNVTTHDPFAASAKSLQALLLNASLLFSCFTAYKYVARDLISSFSGAHEMASLIQSTGVNLDSVAAHRLPQATAVLVQLPTRTLWYPAIGRRGSHMEWNREMYGAEKMPVAEAVSLADRQFPNGKELHLLLSEPLPDHLRTKFRLVCESRGDAFFAKDEDFFLYVRRTSRDPERAPNAEKGKRHRS